MICYVAIHEQNIVANIIFLKFIFVIQKYVIHCINFYNLLTINYPVRLNMGNVFRCIITPLLTLVVGYVFGQSHIKGLVVDSGTGEPLIGANVIVKNDPSRGTVTDFDGAFDLKIDKLPVMLNISYIGYNSLDYEITSEIPKHKILLSEESVTIDLGVEIKGQRVSDKQKAAPLTIESLDAIAIKQTASTDFYNGLGSLKGVDLTTASLGFTVINTRGFNSTSPVRSLQTIDGVDNQSPGLNFSLGNFLGASELDIQKVDLVVGASSAFYGPNAFNGVIAMETKNPFFSKGLAASVKVGERTLFETGFRYANAIKNKSGKDFIGYKLNFSYLKAYDWVADNYDPVTDSEGNQVFSKPSDNPGGWDAVNIYGDQYSGAYSSLYDSRAGLNRFFRKGYKEVDLVDYNTKNIKAGAAIHFRTNPSKDFESPEIIIASNFGYGTTVYQGDNRFSLRGIQFYQQKIEFRKKDKFFIRAYATNENAGDSFDPYFTALKMLQASKSNEEWKADYEFWWVRNNLGAVFKKMKAAGYGVDGITQDQLIDWQNTNVDSLQNWHNLASVYANQAQSTNENGHNYFEPGTARFDSLFNSIVTKKNNSKENGTRFFDKSALYHVHGEYKFNPSFLKEWVVGANFRMYKPNTDGTIFSDTISSITNKEFGVYTGGSKEFGDFTASIAARMDKNQNFNYLFSPAASIVWKTTENNYLRLSFSSAIRNPTLSDQYLHLKVGPALLLGNIKGFNDLVSFDSFTEWIENPNEGLKKISVGPIKPEKVKTFEVGYRTTLFERLFLDASYFYNIYNDFIGYQIGLLVPVDTISHNPLLVTPRFGGIEVLRVSANSKEVVNSQGFALGLNYYFGRYYSLNGNYSYNNLITKSKDDIVPAFNTPKNKFNIGIAARDIPIRWQKNTLGFNVNYKWIQGFKFTGSPQFTGDIPTYDLVDCQLNLTMPKYNAVLKVGASNALNNKQFQTYGGPRIGRMAYISVVYDFKKKI